MNKVWKEKWVKALRSGRYKQAEENLYDFPNNSYCCLGVLRKIMYPVGRDSNLVGHDECGGEVELLHTKQLKKAHLHHATQKHLADMNDRGDSFGQIADYIEKRL